MISKFKNNLFVSFILFESRSCLRPVFGID